MCFMCFSLCGQTSSKIRKVVLMKTCHKRTFGFLPLRHIVSPSGRIASLSASLQSTDEPNLSASLQSTNEPNLFERFFCADFVNNLNVLCVSSLKKLSASSLSHHLSVGVSLRVKGSLDLLGSFIWKLN